MIHLTMKESILRVAGPATMLYFYTACLVRTEGLSSHAAVPSWVSARGGLPFDCTGCGDCCQVEGDVWLSPSEATDMAASLKLSPQSFDDAHCDVIAEGSGWRRLISVAPSASGLGGGCTFLTAEGGCGVYGTRPQQCISYPFWPRILRSPESWDREIGACEGIGLVGRSASGAEDSTIATTSETKDTASHNNEPATISAVPLDEVKLSSLKYAAWLRRFPEDAAADISDTAQWAKGSFLKNLPHHSLQLTLNQSAPGAVRYEHHPAVSDYMSLINAIRSAAERLLVRNRAGIEAELAVNNAQDVPTSMPASNKVAMVMFPQLSDHVTFQKMFAKLEMEWQVPLSGDAPSDENKDTLKALLRIAIETPADTSKGRRPSQVKVDRRRINPPQDFISLFGFHPQWESDGGVQGLLGQRSPIPMICLVLG